MVRRVGTFVGARAMWDVRVARLGIGGSGTVTSRWQERLIARLGYRRRSLLWTRKQGKMGTRQLGYFQPSLLAKGASYPRH